MQHQPANGIQMPQMSTIANNLKPQIFNPDFGAEEEWPFLRLYWLVLFEGLFYHIWSILHFTDANILSISRQLVFKRLKCLLFADCANNLKPQILNPDLGTEEEWPFLRLIYSSTFYTGKYTSLHTFVERRNKNSFYDTIPWSCQISILHVINDCILPEMIYQLALKRCKILVFADFGINTMVDYSFRKNTPSDPYRYTPTNN